MPIDSPSGAAMKPRGDAAGGRRERRALAGPQLVDRAVEDDQRQDVGLVERRRAGQLELRRLALPVMCTRASTPVFGIWRVAVTSSSGLISGSPGEPDGAAAHQIEPAPLELVGPAHRVDRAEQHERTVGLFGDVDIPADRDVQVADRGAGRPARPEALAAQHEVLRDAQRGRRSCTGANAPTSGQRCGGLSLPWRRLPAAARALRVRQRLPGRILRAPAALRRRARPTRRPASP